MFDIEQDQDKVYRIIDANEQGISSLLIVCGNIQETSILHNAMHLYGAYYIEREFSICYNNNNINSN